MNSFGLKLGLVKIRTVLRRLDTTRLCVKRTTYVVLVDGDLLHVVCSRKRNQKHSDLCVAVFNGSDYQYTVSYASKPEGVNSDTGDLITHEQTS